MNSKGLSKKGFISKDAVILGEVNLGNNVFVAPTAVLRADEPGSSITISDNCNVQDGVIIHSLADSRVEIGRSTTLGHGRIVHGPCSIGENCFIGFRTVVFNCQISDGSVILHGAVVEGVNINKKRLVPTGTILNRQKEADMLGLVPTHLKEFTRTVIDRNTCLIEVYRRNRANGRDDWVDG